MNVVERLLLHPERHPDDRLALVCGNESITYGELRQRVSRWQGGLRAAGLGPGHRVVLVAETDPTFVVGQLAVLGVGATVVPLNPASPPAELARELPGARPTAAIVGPGAGASWSAIADDVDVPPTLDLDTLDSGEPGGIAVVDRGTPAALLYTSGTAGMPKPAVLTHGNIESSLLAVESLPIDLITTPQVVLAVIPLFHVFGFNAIVNLGLDVGATLVLEDFTSAARVEQLVADHAVTLLAGPPNLWQALADSPGARPDHYRTVALALSGAAKLPAQTHLAVESRLGLPLQEGYGLTETCATVATSVGTDAPIGSVGRLLPGVEGRLVDESGSDVLVGDPGELWVRGPMVSAGYAAPAGLTALAVEPGENHGADGWLHTGDVAVVDDDGNLAIVDRLKEVVNVSGFNVYPAEVEAALVAHPQVSAAAVIGEPDPATGETLVAFVVPVPGGSLDQQDLVEHCRAELARYKVPTRFDVRDRLPIGMAGKLRRRELRAPNG